MTAWIAPALGLAGGSVRLAVFLIFADRWPGRMKPERKALVGRFAGMWALAGLAWAAALPPFLCAVLEVIWFFFCLRRMKPTEQRLCLFFSIFYEIGVCLWQFLLAAFLGILLRSEAFLTPGSAENLWAQGLSALGLICLAWYVRMRPQAAKKDGYRLASAVSVAGLLAVVTISAQNVVRIPEEEMTMWEIQSVILLMALLLYRVRRLYDTERELAQLKAEQAELLKRDYAVLNRTYETHAKLFHDFRNHMGMLQQLLAREDYTGAARYLEELNGPLRELEGQTFTGDGTVDYLINQKLAQAREQGIDLELQVEYPRRAGIRSADLCAVLGNLLDNALEAAGGVREPEKRWIRLTIRRVHRMVAIRVENSYSEAPVLEQGRLLSTKKEKGLHGWGLASARAAAEKYDGTLKTVCEGKVFRAVAMMSCGPTDTE